MEYEKDRFAVFHREEIRRMNEETSSTMEIVEFVKREEIDPVYFKASCYVAPDKGGDKPYQLLLAAMRRTGYAALAHVAMHGRRQFLILRPGVHGIVMHTLFFEAEVHAADEFHVESTAVAAQEIKLAETLIAHLAATFDPSQFKDERLEKIREAISRKTPATSSVYREEPRNAAVVDIMDALRKSLELQKKPATREKTSGRQRQAAGQSIHGDDIRRLRPEVAVVSTNRWKRIGMALVPLPESPISRSKSSRRPNCRSLSNGKSRPICSLIETPQLPGWSLAMSELLRKQGEVYL